jgi:hypothetical protein
VASLYLAVAYAAVDLLPAAVEAAISNAKLTGAKDHAKFLASIRIFMSPMLKIITSSTVGLSFSKNEAEAGFQLRFRIGYTKRRYDPVLVMTARFRRTTDWGHAAKFDKVSVKHPLPRGVISGRQTGCTDVIQVELR